MLNDRSGPEVGIERTSGPVGEIRWSGLEATTSKNSARAEPMFLSGAKPASSAEKPPSRAVPWRNFELRQNPPATLISAAVSRNILSL
jgi:hypothetical protein